MDSSGFFLILTCEHGGAKIPPLYKELFDSESARQALITHRGQDFGALELSKKIHESLKAPLFFTEISRLLIDCNRSLGHSGLFSEFSNRLPKHEKNDVIQSYYLPYRLKVQAQIQNRIQEGLKILHLSIHSFTPELHGEVRNADLGILYHPKRLSEKTTATTLKNKIRELLPNFKTRFNYPYLGVSDGFATSLRKVWPEENYIGLELEFNQRLFLNTPPLHCNWEGKLIETIRWLFIQ